eukprot:EG_transcript_7316
MCRILFSFIFFICSGLTHAESSSNSTDSKKVIFTIYMEKAGLCNQLFAMMHSLLVATAMGWDYELPEFLYHSNGAVPYERQDFRRTSMSRLLNVKKMQAAFRARGTTLYAHGTTGPTHDVRFENTPSCRPLPEWVQRGKETVERANAPPDRTLRITHHHPGAGDIAIGKSGWPMFKELVQLLYFAPQLENIADKIVQKLAVNNTGFNGVHLRIEEDFIRHPAMGNDPFHIQKCRQGTIQCLENAYFPVFREQQPPRPYYLACGILSVPMDNKRQVLSHLKQVAPVWNYTTQFVTLDQGQGLVYEQLAAIDLLILARADLFIGMARSTFTCFISVYRASNGLPGQERFVDPPLTDLAPNFLPHL